LANKNKLNIERNRGGQHHTIFLAPVPLCYTARTYKTGVRYWQRGYIWQR
jgi:hypothetical protein